MLPSVTAMCPTYGRTSLLEESIESFLRQDYEGPKELVVVNDLPDQTLELPDCPANIKVVNLPFRCSNLGEKRNAVARLSSGELLMTWSDDDIHLPNRISANVRAWDAGRYVTEGCHIFHCLHRTEYKAGRMFGPFCMAAKDFWDLGGIPDAFTGEDAVFLEKVQGKFSIHDSPELSYIYRWGTTERFHASWFDKLPDAWEQIEQRVQKTLEDGKEPRGHVLLRPHWKQNYQELLSCRNA